MEQEKYVGSFQSLPNYDAKFVDIESKSFLCCGIRERLVVKQGCNYLNLFFTNIFSTAWSKVKVLAQIHNSYKEHSGGRCTMRWLTSSSLTLGLKKNSFIIKIYKNTMTEHSNFLNSF